MLSAIEVLLKGIVLGLAVSMPLGPIGIILINRTIKRGVLSGIFSGLGLGTADTLLAVIAGLGFSVVIAFIKQEKFIISVVAGVLITAAGLKVYMSNPVKDFRNREKSNKSLWRDFYSVFMLAITNPYTVLLFVAFYSGVHIRGNVKPEFVPFLLVPGVFIGAMTWWSSLSFFVSRFKHKIHLRAMVKINKIAGIIITGIGVVVLIGILAAWNL
jgi:threonine/homoserine/homoserine lactone efflux protein